MTEVAEYVEVHRHPEPKSFISKWIFSLDHKVIGIQYIILAIVSVFIGMGLSLLIRLRLVWPGEAFPLLGTLFPIGAPDGIMTPEFYLAMMTMHGTVMVFMVLTTAPQGGFGNYILPIQIGAACGAHRVYLPPYPRLSAESRKEIQELYGEDFDPHRVDPKELVAWMETMFRTKKRSYLVVIIPSGAPLLTMARDGAPDGARNGPQDGYESYENIVTSMAPMELTVPRLVDQLVMHFAGQHGVQIRYVVIDDLQLGGTPTLRDRMLGSLYGEAAIEEFLSVVNSQDTRRRGNLNLLAIDDISRMRWRCHPREEVTPLFRGDTPRAGGLDPVPFFRQMRGTVSGYRPWAEVH